MQAVTPAASRPELNMVWLVIIWIALAKLSLEVTGQAVIEEVNDRQLEKLIEENDFVAVAWLTKTCK